jgi:hypothetical protein
MTSAIFIISIAAVKAPLKGSGTPVRAAFKRTNEFLRTSAANIMPLDKDLSADDDDADTTGAKVVEIA